MPKPTTCFNCSSSTVSTPGSVFSPVSDGFACFAVVFFASVGFLLACVVSVSVRRYRLYERVLSFRTRVVVWQERRYPFAFARFVFFSSLIYCCPSQQQNFSSVHPNYLHRVRCLYCLQWFACIASFLFASVGFLLARVIGVLGVPFPPLQMRPPSSLLRLHIAGKDGSQTFFSCGG